MRGFVIHGFFPHLSADFGKKMQYNARFCRQNYSFNAGKFFLGIRIFDILGGFS